MQMVASLRRLDYSDILRARDISPNRAHPNNPSFDPERAAIFHMRADRGDEAFWLIFLVTHFGKHPTYGWQRLRDVYSGLGGQTWTWARVSANPATFRIWLERPGSDRRRVRQPSKTGKRQSRSARRNGCGGRELHLVGRTRPFPCRSHGEAHPGWRQQPGEHF